MHHKVAIRRARISNFLDDHPEIDMSDIKLISEELGISYFTVKEDIIILKANLREIYKQFNLEGLRKKGLEKANRLNELILKARKITDDAEDSDMVLKAIALEANLLNNLYHLEHDGIGIMTIKIETKRNKRKNNKNNNNNSNNNELEKRSS